MPDISHSPDFPAITLSILIPRHLEQALLQGLTAKRPRRPKSSHVPGLGWQQTNSMTSADHSAGARPREIPKKYVFWKVLALGKHFA